MSHIKYFSGGMYVGKITFCFASVRPFGACAQQNGREKAVNFAKFTAFFRTFPLSAKAKGLCRQTDGSRAARLGSRNY